ncbi:LysM peptidoglycan-binding domain-containing protein [Alicycliphilus denitrificans]|uniref:LysM peptidoglycan-binding domain-containing protein n=2 Tax=Alicycliphilus denitrificans TaxID=179636 RepID=A0A3R7LEL9_9BURK|nr:LysM domain-containing protein [Alicycliphilus denitrificans]RKJ95518.1 LysM peptidoglycan-binding domain-containing protein [Alicycliphilus denitrificans]
MHDKSNDMTAPGRVRAAAFAALALGAMLASAAQAQHYPVTPGQRATAQQVASRGVPLSELAANAPDTYVVKRGDTLWGISGMYLQRPWRWPELWGMNLQQIANPHLIYPGQTLYLEKADGYARLRTSPAGAGGTETVRVSPRTRYDSLADSALPTLKMHLIEPFLVEPLVVDELTLEQAPRIVATRDERVIMASGDRVYARGSQGSPLELEPGVPRQYRVFRNAVALKDPDTGEVLGHEAQYLGRAELVRGEAIEPVPGAKDGEADIVPATLDLAGAKEAIRAGDRLLPAPQRSYLNFVPHAPQAPVQASVVSIYGSDAVANAGQNQVIAINLGAQDGMDAGLVLQLRTRGERIKDKTDEDRAMIRLPSEANGLAMVFLTFDRVSYALILQAGRGVRVGDRLVNPE